MRRAPNIATGFQIGYTWDGTKGLLNLCGELDVAAAPELRARVGRFFDDHPGATLLFDLHEVTFVDSTVLGVLVRAVRIAEQSSSTVQVRNAAPAILRVFELTGLNRLLADRG